MYVHVWVGDSSRGCCRVPWPHPMTWNYKHFSQIRHIFLVWWVLSIFSPPKLWLISRINIIILTDPIGSRTGQSSGPNYNSKCVLSFNMCTFLPFQIYFLVTTCFWSNHYSDANFSISSDKVVPSLKLLWCNLWPHMMIMEVADEMLTLGLGGIVVYVVEYTVRTVGSKLVSNTG